MTDELSRAINPRLLELLDEAQAAAGPKGSVLFKWTCGGCGERAGFDETAVLYTAANHTERLDGTICGHVTDLNNDYDNAEPGYMLILPNAGGAPTDAMLAEAMVRRDLVRARYRAQKNRRN